MARYDFDSYTLYEIKKYNVYSVKIRVSLKEPIEGKILKPAAEKAFRRFPYYNRTVAVNDAGAYIFEPCDKPISVLEGDRVISLGTEETNGYLFAVTYEGNDIFFNFAHNFCGAGGAMRWLKATLWAYLTALGNDIDKTGIMTVDKPITSEEQAEPDVAALPVEEYLGNLNFRTDSFSPRNDYIEKMKDPNGIDGYYPVKISKDVLMKYAHDNDGSPNSIISALLFKMYAKAQPSETLFTVSIANNYRADVGCPETYRDMVRQIYVHYDMGMKDWSAEKLSTVTRSRMYIQMQPEISQEKCRQVDEYRKQIDAMPDLDSKVDYAIANSPTLHGVPASYVISYVGKVEWGGLGRFIDDIYTLTYGHMVIEVNATDNDFCITFQTLRKDGKYLKEFLQSLDEAGIPYTVGKLMDRKLPKIVLP